MKAISTSNSARLVAILALAAPLAAFLGNSGWS
jgi:hypothetical protein